MVTAEPKAPASAEVVDESEYPFVELTLRLPEEWQLSWERLFELGELNELFQVERTAEGDLVVTAPPPPQESGWIESLLTEAILPWTSTARWRRHASRRRKRLRPCRMLPCFEFRTCPGYRIDRCSQSRGDHRRHGPSLSRGWPTAGCRDPLARAATGRPAAQDGEVPSERGSARLAV